MLQLLKGLCTSYIKSKEHLINTEQLEYAYDAETLMLTSTQNKRPQKSKVSIKDHIMDLLCWYARITNIYKK